MRSVSSHELWCDKLSLNRLTLACTAALRSADYEVRKYWTSKQPLYRVWSAANFVSHIMVEEVRPISVPSTALPSPNLPRGGSGLSPLASLPPETEQTAVEFWIHMSFYWPHWVRQMGGWVWQQTLSLQSFFLSIDVFHCADFYNPICCLSLLLWKYIHIYFKYITCYIVQLICTY